MLNPSEREDPSKPQTRAWAGLSFMVRPCWRPLASLSLPIARPIGQQAETEKERLVERLEAIETTEKAHPPLFAERVQRPQASAP
jgi:hypothetical protein